MAYGGRRFSGTKGGQRRSRGGRAGTPGQHQYRGGGFTPATKRPSFVPTSNLAGHPVTITPKGKPTLSPGPGPGLPADPRKRQLPYTRPPGIQPAPAGASASIPGSTPGGKKGWGGHSMPGPGPRPVRPGNPLPPSVGANIPSGIRGNMGGGARPVAPSAFRSRFGGLRPRRVRRPSASPMRPKRY